MNYLRAVGGILSICLMISALPVRAAVILTATEDNNVNKGQSTTIQTNGTTFQIKEASSGQSNARLGFIKFDLTGRTLADGDFATFTAELASTASATDDFTVRLYALNAGTTGYDWAESTITYANRPAPTTSTPLVDTGLATLVGDPVSIPRSSPSGTDASFIFSNWDNYRQSDDSMTLILLISFQTTSSPSLTFASSETTSLNPPTLTIDVPEPTTAAFSLVALTLLAARRRQR